MTHSTAVIQPPAAQIDKTPSITDNTRLLTGEGKALEQR